MEDCSEKNLFIDYKMFSSQWLLGKCFELIPLEVVAHIPVGKVHE